MTARSRVKISKRRAQLVGVIASRSDLQCALRLANPPDLYELRLDCLIDSIDELEEKLSILRAPLIITARHPAEGGANRLSAPCRQELLGRFLSQAQYVDVELRSARALRVLLDITRRKKVRRIISFHNFDDTPSIRALKTKARAAKTCHADVFKVVTRTDTPAQLARLLDFFASPDVDLAVSAMGIGKLGAASRLVLTRLGSVFTYASLGRPNVEGQLSIQQLRFALSASNISQGSGRET